MTSGPRPPAPGLRSPAPGLLQAVVFDFDGVIADSEPLHLRALQEALAARGVRLDADEYYAQLLGYDDGAALDVLVEARALPWNARERAAVVADKAARFESLMSGAEDPSGFGASAGDIALFGGAAACVARLGAKVPLAIASGARRAEIDRTLARAGLAAAFRAIVAAGDTARGKPSPDPYARAVALLAVAPSGAVAIEDSRWGLQSASAAGLRTVGVTHSYSAPELATADLVVSSLDEITVERLTALIRAR